MTSRTSRKAISAASGKNPAIGRSGGWLFHCHMLEHAARGMMGFFQVVETDAAYRIKRVRLKRFYATSRATVDSVERSTRKLCKYVQARVKGPTKHVRARVQIFSKSGELLVDARRTLRTDRLRRVPRLTLKGGVAKRAHTVRVTALG